MSNDFRLFVTNGTDHWQVLSFAQNKSDASIYVGAPDFDKVKWLSIDQKSRSLLIAGSPGEGKLSLHGSGIAHVRTHNGNSGNGLRFAGNQMKGQDTLGVRHLFTALLSKPEHVPASAAFQRKSDQEIRVAKLVPYTYVFWAVPSTRALTVEVSAAFDENDLESVPPESGWGALPLALHNVVWFAYRTKHMLHWPRHPHVCFHDGYHVPLLIGTSEGGCRLELRAPAYALKGAQLAIRV